MEAENIKNFKGIKRCTVVIAIFFSAFVIFFTIMTMLSPVRKLSAIEEQFTPKPVGDTAYADPVLTDSTYLELLKEKVFLQARIAMAGTDSIYLTINLPDSTINIEISGVEVHRAKINDIRYSKILAKGSRNSIFSMLATPFTISGSYATIRKEPVMIKMAPKDTSEYIPDIMPDTSLTVPVNYILVMTDGTRVYVYQEENDSSKDRLSAFIFDLKDRLRTTWGALKRTAVFKMPDYHPFIKIKLPRDDAKIIYRAVPKHGQIAIYM